MPTDEIKLGVKLEDIIILSESIINLAQEINHLYNKIKIKEAQKNENTDL